MFGLDPSKVKYGTTNARAKARAKRAAAAAADQTEDHRQLKAPDIARRLPQPLFNCLSCGKVYDASSGSAEAMAVIRSGGVCEFCGAVIESVRKQLEDMGVVGP